MGNEDVVACKGLRDNTDKINVTADVEALKQGMEGLNIEAKDESGEDEKKYDFVDVLPLELIEEVYLYLTPKDLAACSLVRTSWREAVNSNKIWAYHCDKRGWKDDLDTYYSHFFSAHKQFRPWVSSIHSFTPICSKRLLYSKHCCLQNNWRKGKCLAAKITSENQNCLQLYEPVSCDGRYLVLLDRVSKFGTNFNLVVWSLDGIPHKMSNLSLPNKVNSVESIAFDHGTIAVAQAWVIIVYHMSDSTFKLAFTINDLSKLEPKNKLPKDMKRMVPYLKVTQDYIICVPNHSHSTVDFIPIFFWDKQTGELKHSLSFDSMYYWITNVQWFNDSCYLSTVNKKKKSYQIVEFGMKSAAWEAFSQSVTMEVEHITVCDQYILAVTKTSNPAIRDYFASRLDGSNKELWLWDRTTGSALKTFEAQGKGFQFVNDYLMYFDGSRVTVMNPKNPSMSNEFEITGTITSITASRHTSQLVVLKTGCNIEVWDWGHGCRLYTVAVETGYGSQLWCDDKRVITYHSSESPSGGGILVLGFW